MRKVLMFFLAAVLTAGAVAGGVAMTRTSEADDEPRAKDGGGTQIRLDDLDTQTMSLTRGSFCEFVSEDAVATAVGSDTKRSVSYSNGEKAEITDDITDVAHEYACAWVGGEGTAAAWIFAPPVTKQLARTLNEDVPEKCRVIKSAPTFGKPSGAYRCGPNQVTFRGLFGDAWLTCQLEAPAANKDDAVERAAQWCANVAQAATA